MSSVAAHSGHSPLDEASASGLEHRRQELGEGTEPPGLCDKAGKLTGYCASLQRPARIATIIDRDTPAAER